MTQVVFKNDDIELRVGDQVSFTAPKNDDLFYKSSIGELFKDNKCDECVLVVKQREWLEVYFELALYKDGLPLSDDMIFDKYEPEETFKPLIENTDYKFLRYLLSKGAAVTTKKYPTTR